MYHTGSLKNARLSDWCYFGKFVRLIFGYDRLNPKDKAATQSAKQICDKSPYSGVCMNFYLEFSAWLLYNRGGQILVGKMYIYSGGLDRPLAVGCMEISMNYERYAYDEDTVLVGYIRCTRT